MKHIPRKRFGQNFLRDPYIIQQIIELINPLKQENILEIGPGLAALTKPLLAYLDHLEVIELDRDLIEFLQQNFSAQQLTIHSGDALQFDFSGKPRRIIGNLPYNIATPLLFHLSQFDNLSDMTFMLQKEVAERICARPGTHAYGRLSIMLQYKYRCRQLLAVPPQSFYPVPKVDSAIIQLKPRHDYLWSSIDTTRLNLVVSQAFNQRRKTLSNSLKSLLSANSLIACGIDPNLRAENLSVENYLTLSQVV